MIPASLEARLQGSSDTPGTTVAMPPSLAARISANAPVQAKIDPTEGMNYGERLAAGIGSGMTSAVLGIKQAVNKYVAPVVNQMMSPDETQADYEQTQADQQRQQNSLYQQVVDKRALDNPLLARSGGTLGNVIGNTAVTLPAAFIPGANTVGGAALAGGLMGAVQPITQDESRGQNALMGAAISAAPVAALKGVNALTSPAKSALSSSLQTTLSGAQDLGFKVTPGQKLGSASLQKFEAGMDANPLTAGKMADIKAHNQINLNKIWAERIGQDSPTLSDEVLGKAYNDIGSKFEAVKGDTIQLGSSFQQGLDAIKQNYAKLWSARGDSTIKNLVSSAEEAAQTGVLSGEEYNLIRSDLGHVSRDAFKTGNSQLGHVANDLIDNLDNAVQAALPNKAPILQEARGQWKSLKTIEKALNGENVSGPKLSGVLARNDPKGYVYGMDQTPGYVAARFANNFRPIVGDSGTATRQSYDNILKQIAGGATAGGTAATMLGGPAMAPLGAVVGGVAPIVARKGVQAAYLGPVANYLTRVGSPGVNSLTKLLMTPEGAAANLLTGNAYLRSNAGQ